MAISINEIKSADWSLKLSTFGEVVEGYEDINQSINIILKTPKGADVFRPLFGAEITKYIDQPINQAGPQMVREILEALAIWETRIEVTSVNYTVENESINFEIRWILVENRQTGVANIAIQNAPAPELRLSAPPTPLNLSALIVNFSSVSLNWNYELSPIGSVFQIFRSIDGGAFQFIGSAYNSFTFLDSNLLGGNYEYKIRAAKGLQFSEFSNIAIAEIIPVFLFQTTWNTATDGAFLPELTGGTKTWIFGTDTVTADSPNYTGSYLDGSLKTVIVTSPNFSAITTILFPNSKTVVGNLDITLLDGLNNQARFFFNDTLTNIDFASNLVLTQLDVLDTGITSLDLEAINLTVNGTLRVSLSPLTTFNLSEVNVFSSVLATDLALTTTFDLKTATFVNSALDISRSDFAGIDFTSASGSLNVFTITDSELVGSLNLHATTLKSLIGFRNKITDLILSLNSENLTSVRLGLGLLNTISLGGAVISSLTTLFQFSENNMTVSEVNNAWIEVDRVAIATGIARTLDGGGNNAAPSATSLTARNSLISKGYILVI